MHGRLFVTLSLLLVFSFCGYAQVADEEAPRRPAVTAVHTKKLRSFFATFTYFEPPDREDGCWGDLGPLPTIGLKFPDALYIDRSVYVQMDAKDGTVYFLSALAPEDIEKDKIEPMEDAMSREEAFGKAVPVLRHLGLSQQIKDYKIEPDPSRRNTVAHGRWSISRELDYQGRKCLICFISIEVRVATKAVEGLVYYPPLKPREIESSITFDQARESVEAWLKKDPYLSNCAEAYVDDEREITEVVVIPPELKQLRILPEEPFCSSYCWNVPIKFREQNGGVGVTGEQLEFRIPVEIDTGKILMKTIGVAPIGNRETQGEAPR